MKLTARLSLVTAACLALPALAFADTFTSGSKLVDASADIYAAGNQSTLASNDQSGQSGSVPVFISVTGSTYLTFSTTGMIQISPGTYNDPDGVGALPAVSTETGYGSIAGITAPGGGYLTGVFIASGGPSGPAPAGLVYTTTDASSYSPLLDQVFFIGDGLTGDGTGSQQTFYVPAGADMLYLGISDSCNFNSSPSCYLDNTGTFSVSYTDVTVPSTPPGPTPEPSSLALLGTSVLASAGVLRRRLVKR